MRIKIGSLACTLLSIYGSAAKEVDSVDGNFYLNVWTRKHVKHGWSDYEIAGRVKIDHEGILRLTTEFGVYSTFYMHDRKLVTSFHFHGTIKFVGGNRHLALADIGLEWRMFQEVDGTVTILTPSAGTVIVDCLPHGVHDRISFHLQDEHAQKNCPQNQVVDILFHAIRV